MAVVLAVMVGMNLSLGFGVTAATVLVAAFAVLWFGSVAASKRYVLLLALTVLAVAVGAVLTFATDDAHTSIADVIARSSSLISLVLSTGALVWSAALVRVETMAIAFGAGMVLGIPFNASDDPNVWRFTYSLAVTVLALALAARTGRMTVQLAAVLVLAAIGLISDSRSNSSMLLLAGVLLVAQTLMGRGASRRRRAVGTLVLVIGSGAALYSLIVSMILDGAFGEVTQERTQAQIDQGGSLLLGGRPEIAASVALISRNPLGIGSGAGVSYDDMMTAKQSMAAIGYDPNNGYVERYLFGGSVEVHSVLGDLWLWFGLAGAAIAVLALFIAVGGAITEISKGTLTALFAYLVIRFVWDFAFSPASSAFRLLPLTLAISLVALASVRRSGRGRL